MDGLTTIDVELFQTTFGTLLLCSHRKTANCLVRVTSTASSFPLHLCGVSVFVFAVRRSGFSPVKLSHDRLC